VLPLVMPDRPTFDWPGGTLLIRRLFWVGSVNLGR